MARRTSSRAKPKKDPRPAPPPGDAKGPVKDALVPRSGRPEIHWPAIPKPREAAVLALLYQYEESQWWPAETLVKHQLLQLEQLLWYAARAVPLYRERLAVLAGTRRGELTMDLFRRIPLLTRTDIQEAGSALLTRDLPKRHGKMYDISTSGSTGRPITVKGTGITDVVSRAVNLRYHVWHGRDFSAKVANIHKMKHPAEAKRASKWVPGFDSGPMVHFDITRPIQDQVDWLQKVKPYYLLTHPGNLHAMVKRCEETGVTIPNLREVATLGEVLEPEVRAACKKAWGVSVIDAYSAFEAGVLALQCPENVHYHVQSEGSLVEIIDDEGAPCAPGRIGRVVITVLHNFATPLIRYAIGDYAEAGGPCACGRGLPVITRVLGRTRNMLTLPSGGHLWPVFADIFSKALAKTIPSLRQAQLVQRIPEEIEVRLVVTQSVAAEDEERARKALGKALTDAFAYRFVYMDEIPLANSAKFESVKCEIGG